MAFCKNVVWGTSGVIWWWFSRVIQSQMKIIGTSHQVTKTNYQSQLAINHFIFKMILSGLKCKENDVKSHYSFTSSLCFVVHRCIAVLWCNANMYIYVILTDHPVHSCDCQVEYYLKRIKSGSWYYHTWACLRTLCIFISATCHQ